MREIKRASDSCRDYDFAVEAVVEGGRNGAGPKPLDSNVRRTVRLYE